MCRSPMGLQSMREVVRRGCVEGPSRDQPSAQWTANYRTLLLLLLLLLPAPASPSEGCEPLHRAPVGKPPTMWLP